jgi:integrase
MARPRKRTIQYVLHGQSGRARAVRTDGTGHQQQTLLPGLYNSEESLAAWRRLNLEQEVAPKGATIRPKDGLLLVEMLDAYHTFAQTHYRKSDGKPTSELTEVRLVIRTTRELYGQEPAADFGPLKLKAVRQQWVIAKLSRKECNRRTNILRRIFKWAAAEELIPASVHASLAVVTGLQKGRTTARETTPVQPVDDATVDATLPHLGRHVRAMVEFQRLTGCRPGEVCALRLCDIDRSGSVWLFKPAHHKNSHRGQRRTVAIGPRAQEVLNPFLGAEPEAFRFNPAAAVAEIRAERAARRKTPRFKSHQKRNATKRKKLPKRPPASGYSTHAHAVAVMRACDAAWPLPAELGPQVKEGKRESVTVWRKRLTDDEKSRVRRWRQDHRWHPNQLRHSFATKVRKKHGLEAAQVVLGHAKADTTQIYAERNEALAVAVAEKLG